jgi:hypothetical protein
MGGLENFLASYSPDAQKIALRVREEILSAAPYLKEKVYLGWKTIGYSQSGGMKDAVFSMIQKVFGKEQGKKGGTLKSKALMISRQRNISL